MFYSRFKWELIIFESKHILQLKFQQLYMISSKTALIVIV